jgi:hypothetical protein
MTRVETFVVHLEKIHTQVWRWPLEIQGVDEGQVR